MDKKIVILTMPGMGERRGKPPAFVFPQILKIIIEHPILKRIENIFSLRSQNYNDIDDFLGDYNSENYSFFLIGKSIGAARILDKIIEDRYYIIDDVHKIAALTVDPCGPGVKKNKPWKINEECYQRKNNDGFMIRNYYQNQDKPLRGTLVLAGSRVNAENDQLLSEDHDTIVKAEEVKEGAKELCDWLVK